MNRLTALKRKADEFDPTDFYPSSDGEPMAETGIHVHAIVLLLQALQDFFHTRPDVYLAANQYWYFERGNATARRSPDVMAVPGIGNTLRDSYMSWLHGDTPPAVVFEITSRGTWREDMGPKFKEYERLGVGEYFVFDPIDRCLRPRLQGFRLQRKKYRKIRAAADGSLASRLGFRVGVAGNVLRITDEATGNQILTRAENAEEERIRAEKEKERAEQERARAEEERARADRLQAELDRLRRQIDEHKRNGT